VKVLPCTMFLLSTKGAEPAVSMATRGQKLLPTTRDAVEAKVKVELWHRGDVQPGYPERK